MVFRSEDPPPPANLKVDTPPDAKRPTTAMLKGDIDSGRSGDKIPHYDPGLSQLGTDDEAAGRPPGPDRIAAARATEAATPRVREAADPHGRRGWVMPAFIAFIVAAAAIVGGVLWLAPA